MMTADAPRPTPSAELKRFLAIGAIAFCTNISVLWSLIWTFELAAPAAGAIGFLASVFVAYCGQNFWVFPRRGRRGKLLRYAALAAFGILLNVSIMVLATDIFSTDWIYGWAVSTLVLPGVNFILGRAWVFS